MDWFQPRNLYDFFCTCQFILKKPGLFTTKVIAQSPFPKEKIKWIGFQWNDPKDKDAIFLKSRLDTLDYNFYWQLDTGSPYTFIMARWDIFNNEFNLLHSMVQKVDSTRMGEYYKVFKQHSLLTIKNFVGIAY